MPTLQALLDNVDTTYRNSYATAVKVGWMNDCQNQIFQKVPKDAEPYAITTVDGYALYDLPADCDRFGLRAVTIETGVDSDRFDTLPFVSLTSNRSVGEGSHFYSILKNQIFISPVPNAKTAGRRIILFYNKRPAQLSSGALGEIPELEEGFQELLVLGTLERIARARGEIEDKNNFAADYNALIGEYVKMYKLRQPENYRVKDVMPSRNRRGNYRWQRNSVVSDLIPPGP